MSGAATTIYCLPPAGGSPATFRPWLRDPAGAVPALEPVNIRLLIATLRGRLPSGEEPGGVSLLALAAAVVEQLPTDRPFALAGHSLGGLVAYEAALLLQRRGAPAPDFVLVMGSRPPHASSAEVFAPMLHLPDEEFLDALEQVGAVNAALRHSPMRALFLPSLRADLRILTTYRPDIAARRREPLRCPLVAWSGTTDLLAPHALLQGWLSYTRAPQPVRSFAGGHFFPFEEARLCLPALATLSAELAATTA